jgi:hypothetical protein
MRKASYLFLVLAILSPFVTFWVVQRESDLYATRFGVRPEGMGIFGMVAMGAAVTFVWLTLSAFMALLSYLALRAPRALLRRLELGIICLVASPY